MVLKFNFTSMEVPNAQTGTGTSNHIHEPRPRLYRPIFILLVQFSMLALTIAYIVYTSTGHRYVSQYLADFVTNEPTSTTAGFTLLGSLLSLINVKFSNEIIRFALNVSLADSKHTGTRLFTFSAVTKMAQRSAILKFDNRLNWTILTIFNIVLFTAQTSAWTTLFTPRMLKSKISVPFQDGNFSEPTYVGNTFNYTSGNQIEILIGGYDAARQNATLLGFFAHSGFEFIDGSTRGILLLPGFNTVPDNWSNIKADQQGSTADVTCEMISNLDPSVQRESETSTFFNTNITDTYLCCNCTDSDLSGQGYNYLFSNRSDVNFIIFTVCPYLRNTNKQGITIYTYSSLPEYSRKCTIRPQLLTVSVEYDSISANLNSTSADSGIVGVDVTSKGPNLDLNSTIVANFVDNLGRSFFFAQSGTDNEIISALDAIVQEKMTSDSEYVDFINQLMENFIRGIYETSITSAREALGHNNSLGSNIMATVSMDTIVWGQIPRLRVPVILAPLVIMALNLAFLIHTFTRCGKIISAGRWDDLERVMYFDPMDVLHVLSACKLSDMKDLDFPGYNQDIEKYAKDVEITLRY